MKVLDSHNHWSTDAGAEVLEQLARADTPALATDPTGHVIYWNPAAERLFGRSASQTLGRRCYEVLGWRDVFGNRFCHENCAVLSMVRKGEPVHGFEVTTAGVPHGEGLNVTVMQVPSSRSESHTLVHILQPIDRAGRLERALERLGASRVGEPAPASDEERRPPVARPIALAKTPPLTEREREILRWLADGLQNKEIARELGISLATVRNHVHNMLEKLDVHSKLEAVSLAFRQGWVSARGAEPERGAERARA